MRRIILLMTIGVVAMFLSSCLTVEKKQYTFELNGKGAGKLTIKYINIMSNVDSAGYTEGKDFEELLSSYVIGTKVEDAYPDAKVSGKRLFEENGVLCGEVIIDFPTLAAGRLYQFDSKSPVMFYTSSVDGETFVETNGTYGGEKMPVVMFATKMKTLTITTSVSKPTDETYVSLLEEYKKSKK